MLHWIPSPFYGTYPYSYVGNFESNTNPAPCGLHLYKNDARNYNAAICHDKIPHIDGGVKYHCECRQYLEFRTNGFIIIVKNCLVHCLHAKMSSKKEMII